MAKYTEAQKRAIMKYEAANYDRVYLKLRKDSVENKKSIQAAADRAGESLTSFITGAIRQRMEREEKGSL